MSDEPPFEVHAGDLEVATLGLSMAGLQNQLLRWLRTARAQAVLLGVVDAESGL